MRISSLSFAIFVVFTGGLTRADEPFCGAIAANQIEHRYVSWSDKRTALEISVPVRSGKARLYRIDVVIGTGDAMVQFALWTEVSAGRASGTLQLPREHGLVRLEAVYHENNCVRNLSGTFDRMKRTS